MGHKKTALRMPEMLLRVMGWNGVRLGGYSAGLCLWRSILENRVDIWILSMLPWGFSDQTWRRGFRRHCPMIVDLSFVWMHRSG